MEKEDKLLENYIKYFGDEPPLPPRHIMESLVKMKDEGNFDEVMGKILPEMDDIKKRIKDAIGTDLKADSPIFDKEISDNNQTLYYNICSGEDSLLFITDSQWKYFKYRDTLCLEKGNDWKWVKKHSKEWGEYDELVTIAMSHLELEDEYKEYQNGSKIDEDDKSKILDVLNNGFDFIKYNQETMGLIMDVTTSLDVTSENLPDEISDKYGHWGEGVWGTFYSIDIKHEKSIVSDLEKLGYKCIKRELDFEG